MAALNREQLGGSPLSLSLSLSPPGPRSPANDVENRNSDNNVADASNALDGSSLAAAQSARAERLCGYVAAVLAVLVLTLVTAVALAVNGELGGSESSGSGRPRPTWPIANARAHSALKPAPGVNRSNET